MGLKSTIVFLIFVVTGCAGAKNVTPADRVRNETFRFDCCDPGLNSGTKDMCDMAKENPSHALKDMEGNRYEFIWSDCGVGKEPWRKWE